MNEETILDILNDMRKAGALFCNCAILLEDEK